MSRNSRARPLGIRVPAHTKARVALLASLLLAGAITATGCGETTTSSTAASAAAQHSNSTPTASASGTTTTPTTTGSGASSTGAHPAGSSARARHSRVHLVLPPPGAHPEPKASSQELASAPVADIALSSAAIKQSHTSSSYTLAGRYTCHGSDQSPPLHWSGIPHGTKELALLVISTTPVDGKLYFDWALAGLDPKLNGLQSGKLPAGAILGTNGQGHTTYTICPPAGHKESYVFLLYALPQSLHLHTGFDPATLRKEAMHLAKHTGLLVGTYG